MTLRSLLSVTLMLLASTVLAQRACAQDAARKGSPFDALRWVDDQPEVRIDNTWYEPVTIHGVEVQAILEFCAQRWPGQLHKRFGEDLVEAMEAMGHPLPAKVDLVLAPLAGGDVITRADVEITRAKREAIRMGGRAPAAPPPATLPRDQARADLMQLAERLEDQFAYLHLRGVDLHAEIDAIAAQLPDPVDLVEFGTAIGRLMARFGDGHAGARSPRAMRPTAYPPFLLADAADGVVAFVPDRSGLLDPEHPYILEIDGRTVDAWIEQVRPSITAGSAQLIRSRALRALRDLELLRRSAGHDDSDKVRVRLTSGPGARPVERVFSMSRTRPTYGAWPRRASGVLEHNLGYLRLPRMDDDLVPHLRSAMTEFRNTDGLIVDVRGNGGGSRSLLLALAGYLVGPDEGPWVGNVAKYILSDAFGRDHLEARYMYRASDNRWNAAQRAAIDAVAEGFEPEWKSQRDFSAWH